jgi:signal transduction histidine kinase
LERETAQLISTVSHELRTPLTSIKGAVELALSTDAGVSSAKAEKLLSIAQRNTDRLLLIVNDILDLEKIETELVAFDTKSISLKKLAHETIATNKPYLDDLNVSAKIVAKTDDLHVDADPDRLTQVLTNLLSNAAKYSNAGDVININLWSKEDTVGFSVIDRGDGIPAVALDTIFERFRQVAGARQIGSASSGLGLAIVKTIVERHSGRVWIESQEGKGTSVHCQFPNGEAELSQNEVTAFS